MSNQDYSVRQLLEMEACTNCQACADICPAVAASQKGELSAVARMKGLRQILKGRTGLIRRIIGVTIGYEEFVLDLTDIVVNQNIPASRRINDNENFFIFTIPSDLSNTIAPAEVEPTDKSDRNRPAGNQSTPDVVCYSRPIVRTNVMSLLYIFIALTSSPALPDRRLFGNALELSQSPPTYSEARLQ